MILVPETVFRPWAIILPGQMGCGHGSVNGTRTTLKDASGMPIGLAVAYRSLANKPQANPTTGDRENLVEVLGMLCAGCANPKPQFLAQLSEVCEFRSFGLPPRRAEDMQVEVKRRRNSTAQKRAFRSASTTNATNTEQNAERAVRNR